MLNALIVLCSEPLRGCWPAHEPLPLTQQPGLVSPVCELQEAEHVSTCLCHVTGCNAPDDFRSREPKQIVFPSDSSSSRSGRQRAGLRCFSCGSLFDRSAPQCDKVTAWSMLSRILTRFSSVQSRWQQPGWHVWPGRGVYVVHVEEIQHRDRILQRMLQDIHSGIIVGNKLNGLINGFICLSSARKISQSPRPPRVSCPGPRRTPGPRSGPACAPRTSATLSRMVSWHFVLADEALMQFNYCSRKIVIICALIEILSWKAL